MIYALRKVKLILGLAIGIAFLATSSFAVVSKEELMDYHSTIKAIHDECMFLLEPGTLKKSQMSSEQMIRNRSIKLQSVYGKSDTEIVVTLKYCRDFFSNAARRLSNEVKVNDTVLASWHRKLILGLTDSYTVTKKVVKIMDRDHNSTIESVLQLPEISNKVLSNARFHRELKNELEELAKPTMENELQLRKFLLSMPIEYIENTWK